MKMKTWFKNAACWLALTAAVPQFFVFAYFAPLLYHGGNRLGLAQTLALLGLSVSWVSAPFFAAAMGLYKALVARRVRWYAVMLACTAAGYLWVVAWNVWVYDLFAYGRSFLPAAVCGLATSGCALARHLYHTHLRFPAKKQEAVPAGEADQ